MIELELNSHEFLKYWIEEDARAFDIATEFFKKVKNDMKRSYTLMRTQAANPRGLGVRPRETGKSTKAYPSLPTTLEETVGAGSNRTVTWVEDTKPTTDQKDKKGARTEMTQNNDALYNLQITVR